MIIAIDCDGTIVEHYYPKLGKEVPGAFKWIKRFQELGAKLILYTMRDKKELTEAIEFCSQFGIKFEYINENPNQKTWTTSPKVYANIYIDDAAFGCPLIWAENGRPYVNWDIVGPAIEKILLARLDKV